MIYLDNAATSFPKPEKVYSEMLRCIREYCGNPGRGGHSMAVTAGKAVLKAREKMASFLGVSNPFRLCFMKNATEALNTAIWGCVKPGDHVITTPMEHNSVMRPLKTLEKELGIELSIVRGGRFGEIDPVDIKKRIKASTRLLVSTFSSNVNGIVMPLKEMGEIAREHGILFLVDGAQGVGTMEVDVSLLRIDMLAFSGHKGLMGPQGTGGLFIAEGINLKPLMQGGTGSFSLGLEQPEIFPDRFESGTLNLPGIVGLMNGVAYIEEQGIEKVELHKHKLTKRLIEGLNVIKRVRVYSKAEYGKNSGIVAFNIDGTDSSHISYLLDKKYGIATRGGLHCAPLAHETLGTLETGLVRVSVGCFNSEDEIDELIAAVEDIVQIVN